MSLNTQSDLGKLKALKSAFLNIYAMQKFIVLHRSAYKKRNPWQFFARSCGKT